MKYSKFSIYRLILYRNILQNVKKEGKVHIYSHEIAYYAGNEPTQVRRDLMLVRYNGTRALGYNVEELIKSISKLVDATEKQNIAIIGIGNLGRAVLDYINSQRSNLKIIAAFDISEEKVGRVIHGTRCYHVDELEKFIEKNKIKVVILSVPSDKAQGIAERLAKAGIRGILNYTGIRLDIPDSIFTENRDMLRALEEVDFFARLKK